MNPTNKTLSQWLVQLEANGVTGVDLSLERIKPIAVKLGLVPFPAKVITVAGTNGKGSTVTCLEALALQAGLRVGATLSPHLYQFNERVRIQGQMASDAMFCEVFAKVEVARGQNTLSYFEFIILAALVMMREAKVDLAILEVGLGGRLDATNCIDADIAVITSISLDHETWLGSTREAIAFEKAGIMRAGKPLVYAEANMPVSVKGVVEALQCPVYQVGKAYQYHEVGEGWRWQYQSQHFTHLPKPNLYCQNAAAALMAFSLLGFDLTAPLIESAFSGLSLDGRFQRVASKPETVLDVAHNPASAAYLAENLRQFAPGRTILAVVAMMADKNHAETVAPLVPLVSQWYIAEFSGVRALPATELAAVVALQTKASCKVFPSVSEAVKQARIESSETDLIVVFGSFHCVCAVGEDH